MLRKYLQHFIYFSDKILYFQSFSSHDTSKNCYIQLNTPTKYSLQTNFTQNFHCHCCRRNYISFLLQCATICTHIYFIVAAFSTNSTKHLSSSHAVKVSYPFFFENYNKNTFLRLLFLFHLHTLILSSIVIPKDETTKYPKPQLLFVFPL